MEFLKGIWEGLKGTAEYKLNHMSEVVYNYGVERYGVFQRGRKEKQGQAKSRWQVEIRKEVAEEAIETSRWWTERRYDAWCFDISMDAHSDCMGTVVSGRW